MLAESLKLNTTLTHLDLSHIEINDIAAKAIATAILTNQHSQIMSIKIDNPVYQEIFDEAIRIKNILPVYLANSQKNHPLAKIPQDVIGIVHRKVTEGVPELSGQAQRLIRQINQGIEDQAKTPSRAPRVRNKTANPVVNTKTHSPCLIS